MQEAADAPPFEAEAPPSEGEGVTVAAAIDEASTDDAFDANDEDAAVDVNDAETDADAGADFAGQREAPATK